MDLYVARQPIFNARKEVVAYELLYRSNMENASNVVDGDAATLTVINNTAFSMGVQTLTNGRRAFINFTKKLIMDEMATIFPREAIVVEILEDIIPDEAFLTACRTLKENGYVLALDDFVLGNEWALPLMDLVDIVKVDFMLSSIEERDTIVKRYGNGRIRFLAEKVETEAEFMAAVVSGYSYFQGYFFARPVVVQGKEIKGMDTSYLQVMEELSKAEVDYTRLAEVIERDISMSYKLMRLVNSPAFYSSNKIKSVKQALARLGENEIRRWASVLMVRSASIGKTDEIARMSLLRAKMAELIAERLSMRARKQEMFLAGLFSMLDVMMDRPLNDILGEMPLADPIKDALMGIDNIIFNVLTIILLYEKADWVSFEYACSKLKLTAGNVTDDYYEALQWTQALFGEIG